MSVKVFSAMVTPLKARYISIFLLFLIRYELEFKLPLFNVIVLIAVFVYCFSDP